MGIQGDVEREQRHADRDEDNSERADSLLVRRHFYNYQNIFKIFLKYSSVFLFVIVYMTFAPYSADYYVLRKGIGRPSLN